MSSSSPTDGGSSAESPAAKRSALSSGSAPPRGPAEGAETVDGGVEPPHRPSRIPLPAGFRQRSPSGPGLDFSRGAAAAEPFAAQEAQEAVGSSPGRSPRGSTARAGERPAAALGSGPPRPRARSGAEQSECAPAGAEAPGAEAPGAEPVPSKRLPRLMLAPLEPAELIYERLHEPSDDSPILYRERAYLVDSLQTDDDLEEHLEAELSRIRRDWRHRDASQFVHLALFDHRFQGEPAFPPIATLSWKDWQGRTEIWVRGIRRSTLPPGMPLDSIPPLVPRPGRAAENERRSLEAALQAERVELEEEPSVFEPVDDLEPLSHDEPSSVPLEARVAAGSDVEHLLDEAPPESEPVPVLAASEVLAPEQAPDSGPDWQAPHRSGEFSIPLPEELAPAPSSHRVLASEELIGALFERMHELALVSTIGAGADYVLGALAEQIPCDGAVLHVLDVDTEEFVVLRALGPDSLDVLGRRTPALDSHLSECLRRKATLELGQSDIARCRPSWQALGVLPRHVIASPIYRKNGPLGVLELGRTTSKGPFSSGQVRAVEYACEQFAELVSDRPIDLARASLYPITPP